MKLFITIFQDEDGMFIVECPSIPVKMGTVPFSLLLEVKNENI